MSSDTQTTPQPHRSWRGGSWTRPLVTFGSAGMAFTRRMMAQSDEADAPRAPDADEAVPPARAEGRWLFYLGALVVGAVLILGLPSSYAIPVLVAFVVVLLVVAARDAELTPRRAAVELKNGLREMWQAVRRPHELNAARRAALARSFTGLAVVLMIVAANNLRPEADRALLDDGLLWMLGGGLALGVALSLMRDVAAPVQPTLAALTPTRAHWGFITLGAALLALAAEISGQALDLPFPGGMSTHTQFFILCGGIVLVAWGLGGSPRLSFRFNLIEALPLLAILALALALRVAGLNDTVRTLVDEVHFINGVQHLWWNPNAGILTTSSQYLPTTLVYSYGQMNAIALFGRDLLGLRMTSAIAGTVNVFALYLLARALFDRKVALVAALLLATFPPHLHFSRIAMAHMGDVTFGTLALAFFVRGLKFNRRPDWALAGVFLGLTQYFFEGGRLLFPPLVAASVVFLIMVIRGHLRAQWRGLVVAALGALFVAAPVYYTILALDASRTSRMDESGLGPGYWTNILADGISPDEQKMLFDRFTFPFQVLIHQPELAQYYAGDHALILEYLAPLFMLGVFFVFWRVRSPTIMILLWVIATAVGNALIRDSAQYPRWMVVFPALVLLIAVGLRYTLALLWPAPAPDAADEPGQNNVSSILRPLVFVGLLVAIAFAQASFYFGPQLALFNVQLREAKAYPDGNDAVLRSLNFPANTQVYLISGVAADKNPPRNFYNYLLDHDENLQLITMASADVTPEFVSALPRDRNYAFFVEPGSFDVVNRLGGGFALDAPQETPFDNIPPDRAFILYFAPMVLGAG